MTDLGRRGLLKGMGAVVAVCAGAVAWTRSPAIATDDPQRRCSACPHPIGDYDNIVEVRWTKWQESQQAWFRPVIRTKTISTAFYHPRCAKKVGIDTLYGDLYGYDRS